MKPCLAIIAAALASAGAASAQTPSPQRLAPVEAPVSPPTATIDLEAEIPQMKGYVLVQALNTVPPGMGRTLHSHVGRPEILRVLSGVLTEVRNGGPPKQYGPGSTLINAGGIEHTWANLGTEPLVFIATQIKPK